MESISMNYADAVKKGCRKVVIRLKEPQHFIGNKPSDDIPNAPLRDVVIIREEGGKYLGLTESSATYVFTEDEIAKEFMA